MKRILFVLIGVVSFSKVTASSALSENQSNLSFEDYQEYWSQNRFQTPELNIMAAYCAKCHGNGSNLTEQFLIGTENEVLGKVRTLRGRIIEQIQSGEMPPRAADRDKFKSSGDEARVLNYLRGLTRTR